MKNFTMVFVCDEQSHVDHIRAKTYKEAIKQLRHKNKEHYGSGPIQLLAVFNGVKLDQTDESERDF